MRRQTIPFFGESRGDQRANSICRRSLLMIFIVWLMCGAASAQEPHPGKDLFRNHCKACHNVDKKLVGPALKDVHLRRDSVWLYNFIKNSQAMIADGDSTAVALYAEYNQVLMPPQSVSPAEIGFILDYIKVESKPKPASANPIQRPAPTEVVQYDQLLFGSYFFWIPFTIAVVLLIIAFYYMTVLYDISQKAANS